MKDKVFKIMDVPTLKEIEDMLENRAKPTYFSADFATGKDISVSMTGRRSGKTFFWEHTDHNRDAADAFVYGIRGILWEGVAIEERAKIFNNGNAIKADFEVIEEKPEPQEIKLLNP